MKPRTERRAPRLQLGCSFCRSLGFTAVRGSLPEFDLFIMFAGFQDAFSRVPGCTRALCKPLTQRYDLSLPKPKVGGSTPSGTAIFRMRSTESWSNAKDMQWQRTRFASGTTR